jgi:hypothetical protein
MRAEVPAPTMSDTTSHAPSPDDHGDEHGDNDHAPGSDALGPVDVMAWGALLIGVAAGLVIVLCLVLTTALIG